MENQTINTEQLNKIELPFVPSLPQAIDVCPTCNQKITGELELEFLKDFNECAQCDHNRSDIYDNYAEMENSDE